MGSPKTLPDVAALRTAIQEEYDAVACEPSRGFHFHTGRVLTKLVGYEDAWFGSHPGEFD